MKKTNESGRTMLEMLAVLAVIGVLSTIGILGYRRAMNNHNANETASDVMKMAAWVSGQRMLAQTGNIDGFKKRSPYNITLSNADGANTTFTLTAEQIPESVCEKLTNMNWTLPVITPETCSGTADMTFTFNNDLSAGSNQPADPGLAKDVPCGDGFCFHGQTCVDSDDQGDGIFCGSCNTEAAYCCQDSSGGTYPIGYTQGGESCVECSTPNFAIVSNNTTQCCSPAGKIIDAYGFNLGTIGCCEALGGFDNSEGQTCCRGNGYSITNEVVPDCCMQPGVYDGYTIVARSGTSYTCVHYNTALENADSYDEWHCCPEEQGERDAWCLEAMTHCS